MIVSVVLEADTESNLKLHIEISIQIYFILSKQKITMNCDEIIGINSLIPLSILNIELVRKFWSSKTSHSSTIS